MRVDESAQLLVVDAEVVEEALQERNHFDQSLVAHQNEHLYDIETRVLVHHFGVLVQKVEEGIGVVRQLLQSQHERSKNSGIALRYMTQEVDQVHESGRGLSGLHLEDLQLGLEVLILWLRQLQSKSLVAGIPRDTSRELA